MILHNMYPAGNTFFFLAAASVCWESGARFYRDLRHITKGHLAGHLMTGTTARNT